MVPGISNEGRPPFRISPDLSHSPSCWPSAGVNAMARHPHASSAARAASRWSSEHSALALHDVFDIADALGADPSDFFTDLPAPGQGRQSTESAKLSWVTEEVRYW